MTERTGFRTTEVMSATRLKVASRAFAVGDRLPSIRGFAKTMGVSPSTVVEAYNRLVAEGLIKARRGSGYYIAATALPALSLVEADPHHDRAVDPFWVSRQSLDAKPSVLKPGCGWLPADWMPNTAVRRALRARARGDDCILAEYGSARGSPVLRRHLMSRFAEDGIEASPEQILLTVSGTQAIDLVCRFLLRPGDTVLVDDPCYFNFRAILRVHQAKVIGVPYTTSGPDMASFEAIVSAEHPRLYITNSALHNPTGATLAPQTAHHLLNIAARHNLIIVEDEIFADFEPEPSPRLAALDGLNRVIRIGSFSKTLSASVRCGYVVGRRDWIEELVDLQIATGFGGPSPLATEVIASVLTGGGYRKHMDELRIRLARSRRETSLRLISLGIEPWVIPRGGLYLWCRLPDDLDAVTVARAALTEDIVLAPGNVFSVSDSATGFMRFNVARCGDVRIWEVMSRAINSTARGGEADKIDANP